MPLKTSRRVLAALLTTILGVTSLASCSKAGELTAEDPVNLRVGYTLEPVGLDPATVSGAGTPFVLLYNVYETLVRVDGEGTIKPLLANEWTVSEDGLDYTFNLDPAAKFANGKEVTAEKVKQSIERSKSGAGVTDSVSGDLAVVDSVEATEDKVVTVHLSQPSNEWLFKMTGVAGIIYADAAATDLNTTPAGSGPFVFDSWDQGNQLALKKNVHYWGTPTRVDEVDFKVYADGNAMNSAMLAGDLDVISNLVVPDSITQFSDESKYTTLKGTSDGEVTLGFNHSSASMKDLKVRQAINHAIDRQAIIDSAWGGQGSLIGSMVAPTDPWYEDLSETYPHDTAKAKALLAEAGVTNLTLRLRVPTLPYATSAARLIAAQLKEVGITVQVDELEFATWLEQVYTGGDYDMTIVAHVEPHDLAKFANPDYYWHYDNAEFQALVKEADAGTAEEQTAKLKEAAKLLADDAAADWLFLLPNLIITRNGVTGINANATNLSFDLTAVAVKN